MLNAPPCVGDDAGAGSCSFENTRRGREPEAGHAVAIYVERSEAGAEECVVIGSSHVPGKSQIGRRRLCFPSCTAEQKGTIREERSRLEEELFDASFPVGQTVAQKTQIARKRRVSGDRIMGLGIQRIINRDAGSGPARAIGAYDGFSAAIGENHVVAGDHSTQMMSGVGVYAFQCRRRVYVPIYGD